MPLRCERHAAFLYDRGGQRLLGSLGPLTRVKWERLRDDTSYASVYIASRSQECDVTVGLAAAGRSELVIYRGDERVWEGPITHVTYEGNSVTVQARDITHYIYRTVMKGEYNNAYPNVGSAIQRVDRILRTEMARMEAQDPPVNVLPHVTLHETPDDARTSSHTLPFDDTVFGHMDELAARGGIDYTTVGRALHLFDVHTPLGQTGVVSAADFIGNVIITEYGMDLATYSAVTDGEGNAGEAGGPDPYYGLVEVLNHAYDENTRRDDADLPTVEEMTSQAVRNLAGRNPTPIVVRVPDNSSLNPQGSLAVGDLVPGTHIPLQANLPGRSLSQMQKLDKVVFEETPDGEDIRVTMSPASGNDAWEEEEE